MRERGHWVRVQQNFGRPKANGLVVTDGELRELKANCQKTKKLKK